MGAPKAPNPTAPPQAPDLVKAQIAAMNYAATEKKIRASSGRKSTFLTSASTTATPALGGKTALGQ